MGCKNSGNKLILKSNSYPKNLDNIYEKFDEKNKSQFMTVLAENQLFDSSILNLSFNLITSSLLIHFQFLQFYFPTL